MNGFISIRAGKNALGGKRKDSKSSLHAISISVDPSRKGSSRGSLGLKSEVAGSSIMGILSERIHSREF